MSFYGVNIGLTYGFQFSKVGQNIAIVVRPGIFIGDQCTEGSFHGRWPPLINLRKEEFERPRNAFLGAERAFITPNKQEKLLMSKVPLIITEAPAGSIVGAEGNYA